MTVIICAGIELLLGSCGRSSSRVDHGGIVVDGHASSDPRPALAVEPDHRPIDAGFQIRAQPVVREEGVQLGQEAQPSGAYRKLAASARRITGTASH
jgi:hypothetical protein